MMIIPYGRQKIEENDIAAVVEVLRSEFITQGPVVNRFEEELANYCGAKYSVATNSATSALHLACLALGVGHGDVVWTSAITFVASANCARYCNAEVDFIDIDPGTLNISVSALSVKLEKAAVEGRLPKVIIPVHMAGQSCEMEEIKNLSDEYGFKIIEDASHAMGGKYKGRPVGCCEYSHIAVFSFHPVKIITTGEGGIATTNDANLANKMARLRSHGITRDPNEIEGVTDGPWYYQQIDLGYNYRMTDIQAALGLSQMKRLDYYVSERHNIAHKYDELLAEYPLEPLSRVQHSYSSFHLYIIRLDLAGINSTQREIFERMRSAGILVNLHYIPVYRHPYYRKFNYCNRDYPESERYYSEGISLPIYPGLSVDQQKEIVFRLITPLGYQTLF